MIEVFGETPFEPVSKPEKKNYSAKQNELSVYNASASGEITNRYIPGIPTALLSLHIRCLPSDRILNKFLKKRWR